MSIIDEVMGRSGSRAVPRYSMSRASCECKIVRDNFLQKRRFWRQHLNFADLESATMIELSFEAPGMTLDRLVMANRLKNGFVTATKCAPKVALTGFIATLTITRQIALVVAKIHGVCELENPMTSRAPTPILNGKPILCGGDQLVQVQAAVSTYNNDFCQFICPIDDVMFVAS